MARGTSVQNHGLQCPPVVIVVVVVVFGESIRGIVLEETDKLLLESSRHSFVAHPLLFVENERKRFKNIRV